MAVARIRTSDPEVIEFLSRHLAGSGYHLEFVRPGEAVQGEADLEIDATRMDLASAMAQAQREPGLITILQGVLRAEPETEPVQTQQQPVRDFSEYADVSPYARGAELEDEPSKLQQAAQATGNALVTGLNTLGEVTKTTSSRFGAWRARRDEVRAARREKREREMAAAAARRREEEMRRAEEDSRRRAEGERQAAIRREEMARMQAEEHRRREEQARIQAEAAQRQAEEDRRLQAEGEQRRAEVEARQRAEQERLRAEEVAATGIERQHQEELRRAQQQQREAEEQRIREDEWKYKQEQEERQRAAAASREESLAEAEAATVEDALVQPKWEQAERRVEPDVPMRPVVPAASTEDRSSLAPVSWNRPTPKPRISRHRERVFKRAGVAAAIVAVGVISVWSIASLRRPANPLNTDQLRRSVIVDQQKPFGPATAAAPVVRPAARPSARPAAAPKKLETRKPAARARSSRTRATKTSTADKGSNDSEPEVIVRHFTTTKPPEATAKVKVREKDGVKIISEN